MEVKLRFSVLGGWGRSLEIELKGPSDKVDEVVKAIWEAAKNWKSWEEK